MLVEKIKANFNERRQYKGSNTTYDTILQDNVQQLANYLQDKSIELLFNIPSIEIARNDNLEIREAILNMTPEQRKEMGINKSKLWYIKKNIRDGKKIELYQKINSKLSS